jgi:hypothetical protein
MRLPQTKGERRNIVRIEYQHRDKAKPERCWRVRFRIEGMKPVTQPFSDSKYGGKEGALQMAIRFRDAMENELAASDRIYGSFGKFGKVGVSGIGRTCSRHTTKTGERREYWRWQARWPGIDGRRCYRSFQDEKHGGAEGAKVAAEAARAKGVAAYVEHLKKHSMTPVISAAQRDGNRAPFTLFMPPVNEDIPVWRYMDFTKYVSMLQNGGIYLPTVAMLEDPFEGSYARGNRELRPLVHKHMPPAFGLTAGKMVQRLRGHVAVSCWHMNERESAAMWKLYAQTHEAVCVQTTFRKLKAAMGEQARVGMVRYVDYETGWIPESHPLAPFIYKRKSFEHEREVRAIIEPLEMAALLKEERNEARGAGQWVKFDFAETIEQVLVAPDAPPWFLELVRQVTARYEQGAVPVVPSALGQLPFY